MTGLLKFFQHFNYNQIGTKRPILFREEFQIIALDIAFLDLLLTFVDDMLDGNMAVYH